MKTLPLIPRNEMYLTVTQGDSERFVRLFLETWKAIPLGARRRMLKHWRESEWTGAVAPFIRLTGSDDIERLFGKRAPGICGRRGLRITFAAEDVDAMADDAVKGLIAHELAHVCCGVDDPEHFFYENNPIAEMDVEQMVAEWDLWEWHQALYEYHAIRLSS